MSVVDFSKVSNTYKNQYDLFFKNTSPENIDKYSSGSNLTKLTSLAESALHVINRCNPIWDTWEGGMTDDATVVKARQWQLDQHSEIKERLAKALVQKQAYYNNHWFGKITKFFLKLFCFWNKGNTPSLQTAEDFLLRYDSRVPVLRNGNTYSGTFLFAMVPASWVQTNLDTSHFYNYHPSRTIFVHGGFIPAKATLPPAFVRV